MTPLSLARQLVPQPQASPPANGSQAPPASAAQLVLWAAQAWSPETHQFFPDRARALAVELLMLGHGLARLSAFAAEARSMSDAWTFHVIPQVLERSTALAPAPSDTAPSVPPTIEMADAPAALEEAGGGMVEGGQA